MVRIYFFSIPAHGHINPTLPLVRELCARGHHVRYYCTEAFRLKIEAAGAEFMPVDPYLPPAPDDLKKRVGRDFASLIEMAADTTIALEPDFIQQIQSEPPDLIVFDSVCLWGKLLAQKYALPFVCSTTTFAFNQYTARRMKQSIGEILRMITGMPRIGRKLSLLRSHGFDASDIAALIGNDSMTPTIVYTSRLFQPDAETFGENFAFVGPSVMQRYPRIRRNRPLIYISLGTVLHDAPAFYRACIRAVEGMDCDAVISIGEAVNPVQLGALPANVKVFPRVNQLEVLAGTDVFLTHCGMNSVSESLLCGVPMVLYPLQSEEETVAGRALELGAGMRLKRPTASHIRAALCTVLEDCRYHTAAHTISEDFSACGGSCEAADFIESRLS